jgi:hypothetical protein
MKIKTFWLAGHGCANMSAYMRIIMKNEAAELVFTNFEKTLKAPGADPLMLTTVFATSDFMKELAAVDAHLACAFIFRILAHSDYGKTVELTKLFLNSDAMRQRSITDPAGACDHMLAAITNLKYIDHVSAETRLDCVRSLFTSDAFQLWADTDEQAALKFMQTIHYQLPTAERTRGAAMCLDTPLMQTVTLGSDDAFGYPTDYFFRYIPENERGAVIRPFTNSKLVRALTAKDADEACDYLLRLMLKLPLSERGEFFDDCYKTSPAMLVVHSRDKVKAWYHLELAMRYLPREEEAARARQLEPMRPTAQEVRQRSSAPSPVA